MTAVSSPAFRFVAMSLYVVARRGLRIVPRGRRVV